MSDANETKMPRRRVLKMLSSGVVVMPALALTGCSGGDDGGNAAAAAAPQPEPAKPARSDTAPAVPDKTAAASGEPASLPTDTGSMPVLSEDDPQATSLGYTADASTVDAEKYPQYQAGANCSNCALYSGEDGAENGPCSIFAGKLVNAGGWCSVHAPKG